MKNFHHEENGEKLAEMQYMVPAGRRERRVKNEGGVTPELKTVSIS